jgi:hypothetical protein
MHPQDRLLKPQQIGARERLIIAGLYLSKYDSVGLKMLGFESFIEAFNVIGYALGAQPASIKNYRDEFDPLFPNRRKGWHKRPTRDYCLKALERYKDLDLETFAALIKSLVGYDENLWSEAVTEEKQDELASRFAKRLITGLAAEHYFEAAARHPKTCLQAFISVFRDGPHIVCDKDSAFSRGALQEGAVLDPR